MTFNVLANSSSVNQLLPVKIMQAVINAIRHHLRGNISNLQDDGSDTTEVCIFDFGDSLVVELFRGKGSETRLFPNNHRNQQILFGETGLSVKRIRCLGDYRHDHVYIWQYFCRKWLQDNGIDTNPGTKPYNTPTSYKLRDRNQKLQKWNNEIERLELEARDYCKKKGFELP